ncbi:restriction endonuclease [Kitasatospora sp. NPDC004531]
MTPGDGNPQGSGSTAEAGQGDAGCLAVLAGMAVLGGALQLAGWAWAHPLAAAAWATGAAVAVAGLRQVLRRTGLDRSLRRFVQPLWGLVRTGVSVRLSLARTAAVAAVTDRIEQWAHRPLGPAAPVEPAASYVRRPPGYTLEAFQEASPLRFEEMCRELLERDGFGDAQRVGGAGDVGADVIAEDHLRRRVVLQCKRFATAVRSEHVQQFNGTARPVHGAAVPVVVALNGFTAPAVEFANRQCLHLVDRERLGRWGAGQHLYDVLEIDRSPA